MSEEPIGRSQSSQLWSRGAVPKGSSPGSSGSRVNLFLGHSVDAVQIRACVRRWRDGSRGARACAPHTESRGPPRVAAWWGEGGDRRCGAAVQGGMGVGGERGAWEGRTICARKYSFSLPGKGG